MVIFKAVKSCFLLFAFCMKLRLGFDSKRDCFCLWPVSSGLNVSFLVILFLLKYVIRINIFFPKCPAI